MGQVPMCWYSAHCRPVGVLGGARGLTVAGSESVVERWIYLVQSLTWLYSAMVFLKAAYLVIGLSTFFSCDSTV